MNEFIHVLRPSQPRRIMGLAIQVMLGLLLLWLAFIYPPATIGWQVFLIGMGVAALYLAARGWQGSSVAIILDDQGLRQEDGVEIAPLDNIASVDRALFSFKPSNGFLIRLKTAPGRAWIPGMWWRIGRRVGIGGVTGGAETKMMADALSFMVAQRDRPEDYQ